MHLSKNQSLIEFILNPLTIVTTLFFFILLFSEADSRYVKVIILSIFVFLNLLIIFHLISMTSRIFIANKTLFFLLSLISMMFLVSILREVVYEVNVLSSISKLLFLISSFLIGMYYVLLGKRKVDFDNYIKVISWMIFLPVILNFLFYVFGITSNNQSNLSATMLGLFGINVSRVEFLLAYGINSYGPIAAVSAISSFFLRQASTSRSNKLIYNIIFIISIISLLLIDSRGSLLLCLIILLTVNQLSKNKNLLYWAILISPIAFIIIPIIDLNFLDILRRNDSDFTTLNNRTLFWASVISYLYDFQTSHLFGHRLFFQPDSFIIYSIFNNLNTSSVYFSFHNSLLQLLIQIGYFGAFIFLITIRHLSGILSKQTINNSGNPLFKLTVSILLFILLIGNLETVFSPFSPFFFFIVLFIFNFLHPVYYSNED